MAMGLFEYNENFFASSGDMLEAAALRRSRRSYLSNPLTGEYIQSIVHEAKKLNNSFSGARIELNFDRAAEVFGMVLGFGTIKAPPCAAALVADVRDSFAYERCGFLGEAFILMLAKLGFDTCWVTGTYSKKGAARVFAQVDSSFVAAVTPIGFASGNRPPSEQLVEMTAKIRDRKPMDSILATYSSAPAWVRKAMDCVRVAPSAMNSQPWVFDFVNGALRLRRPADASTNKRIDLGIAMLHVSVAALSCGVKGGWEPASGQHLAVFNVAG